MGTDWGKEVDSTEGRRYFIPHIFPQQPKAEIVKTPTSFHRELKDVFEHRKCRTTHLYELMFQQVVYVLNTE